MIYRQVRQGGEERKEWEERLGLKGQWEAADSPGRPSER